MTSFLKSAALVALCALASCTKPLETASYSVVPLPSEVTPSEGTPFRLNSRTSVFYPTGNALLKRNAEFLSEYVAQSMNFALPVREQAEGEAPEHAITLVLASTINNEEGYRLSVTEKSIRIEGRTEQGIFYGIQTLRKSLPAVAESKSILLPAAVVNDEPRFTYRAMHLDVCRDFFPVEFVKKYIDLLALHNMNTFHWHLTDDQGWRIESKKYPKLNEIGSVRHRTVVGYLGSGEYDNTDYGGYYTQEQMKEVVAYAAERYINVLPEIDLPGHTLSVLASYPEFGCTGGPYEVCPDWGVFPDVLCIGNEQAMQFVEDILGELIEIFPSRYIHIGGDEAPRVRWKNCPKCQKRIAEEGLRAGGGFTAEDRLQSYCMQRAERFLNARGRSIIGWDEILNGDVAPNATVMSWRGEGGGIEAARQHHDVIMTPDTYLYFNHYQSKDTEEEPEANGGYSPLAHVYGYEPIPSMLTSDEQKFIKGVQANHWTEYITTFPQLQYMALPRWAALCEIQWSQPEKKDYADFLERLLRLTRLYDALGYNYAKHIFDVTADYRVNTKNGTVDIFTGTIDDAPIHYTLDGTEPTVQSPVTAGVLSVSQSGTCRAMAVRPSGNSRVVTEKITFGKSTCKPIVANQPINEQYKFNGITTLVDGLQGNGNYKTGRWIAFRGNDMDVTIDLCRVEEISSVTFHNCVEKGDWIFDVRSVAIEVSEDGKNFERVFFGEYPEMQESDRNGLYVHKQTFAPVKARYMRIMASPENVMSDWHPGKGYPAFLFVDEIVVN